MRTNLAYPSFTLVLSKSPDCPCPPSYRFIAEEKPGTFSMLWPWHKGEPTQTDTIGHQTSEDLEYSSSFLLPDIFDDNQYELVIQDTDTLDSGSTRSKRRWKRFWSTLITTLLIGMVRCRKGLTIPKHRST